MANNIFIEFLPPWIETGIQPAFYDKESGTVLQQTARMYAKVNELVESVNHQNETIADYIEQFDELHQYVDDYFTNLNVQSEINNKLDAMASDGTLIALITPYLDTIEQSFDDQIDDLNEYLHTSINTINTKVDSAVSGTPQPVDDVSEMTDEDKIYVLTTDGNWYYYDGEDWVVGGVYNATAIGRLSIISSMLAEGSVTRDKLKDKINILSLASSVQIGKFVSGFSPTDGIETRNNSNANTLIFSLSSLNNSNVGIKIVGMTPPEGYSYNAYTYNSEDYTDYTRSRYNVISADATRYDSTTGYAYVKSLKSTQDMMAVTVNTNFDIEISPKYPSPKMTLGDSIKIDAMDMLNASNIEEGVKLTGYAADYTPTKGLDYRFNTVTIQLTDTNIEKLKQAKLYVTDNYPSINHRIIFWTQNGGRYDINMNAILNSPYYDATTQRLELKAFAASIPDFAYVSIAYENDDIKMSPLYTTYLSPENPNYAILTNQGNGEIVAPVYFKAVKNHPLYFYYQNIFRYMNTDLLPLKEVSHASLNSERVAIFNNESVGTSSYAIRMKNDLSLDSYNMTKTINYEVVNNNVGSGQTKKVLMIGDSLTANGGMTERLLALFEDDVMNIELLGSRYKSSQANRFEAWAGWSTSTFVNNASYGGHTNNFYNPSTNTFDFSYYMTQQGYSGVDYVFINLGTNDGQNDDQTIIDNIDAMVASIKSYDSNIKIGLWLPPCRGLGKSINYNFLEDTFKAMRINKLYINTYSNSSDVTLIPVYTNVNPYEDFQTAEYEISDTGSYTLEYVTDKTHPSIEGYYHLGDVMFAWIKYFAS